MTRNILIAFAAVIAEIQPCPGLCTKGKVTGYLNIFGATYPDGIARQVRRNDL